MNCLQPVSYTHLECPSIMMLYHRQSGALDKELETLEQCAPDYYRITNGQDVYKRQVVVCVKHISSSGTFNFKSIAENL